MGFLPTKRFARESSHPMHIDSTRDPIPVSAIASDLLATLRDTTRTERLPVVRTGVREPIDPYVRRLVHFRDRWRCAWCGWWPWGRSVFGLDDEQMLQLDHILPWSAGGSDRSDNLRTLCARCNERRSNETADLDLVRPIPVMACCDNCEARDYGFDDEEIGPEPVMPADAYPAFCGRRHHVSWTRRPERLL